jgi:hypothetical protein
MNEIIQAQKKVNEELLERLGKVEGRLAKLEKKPSKKDSKKKEEKKE